MFYLLDSRVARDILGECRALLWPIRLRHLASDFLNHFRVCDTGFAGGKQPSDGFGTAVVRSNWNTGSLFACRRGAVNIALHAAEEGVGDS